MTPEKRLEELYTMLYEFDVQTGNHAAEKVIKAPQEWGKTTFVPFYGAAARLILDARQELDKKRNGNAAAVKRYYKSCTATYNDRLHGKAITPEGLTVLCNGYSVIAVNGDYTTIPETEAPEDFKKGIFKFIVFPEYLEEITPPTIAEAKAKKAENTAQYGKKNYKSIPIAEDITVNPDTYIDIMGALQDAKAYIDPTANRKNTPIYFINEAGEKAMLLQKRDM